MIRFLLRLIGFLILAAGFVALVIDGTRSIAAGALGFTETGATWAAASPETLDRAKAFFAADVPGGEHAFALFLSWPTFAVLGVAGIVLMLIGRRKRRPVGVVP